MPAANFINEHDDRNDDEQNELVRLNIAKLESNGMICVDLVKKAILSNLLTRKNEAYMVLAILLKGIASEYDSKDNIKHEVFENLPMMFDTAEDLLLFVNIFNKIGKEYSKY